MTRYNPNEVPTQLLEVIAELKLSYDLDGTPLFEESDEFHADRWMVNVVALDIDNPNEKYSIKVEWTAGITVAFAKGFWGRMIWQMMRAAHYGYFAGVQKGKELAKEAMVSNFVEQIAKPIDRQASQYLKIKGFLG